MIYISIDGKTPPPKLLEKARQVTRKLEAAKTEKERNQIIEKNSSVWRSFKEWLLSLSHGKCWFSETKDAYSHPEVEHFRPKAKAKNLDGAKREGYWWLAFEWTNFRICGNVGNRKKGTFFPLREGSFAATSANRSIEDEIYYLLDPANPDDPGLLAFDEEGKAIPTPGLDEWQNNRVEVTIKLLKLYHEPLEEARRDVWRKCRNKLEECQQLMKRMNKGGGATVRERLSGAMKELRQMVQSEAPLSSTAISCLLFSNVVWARRIVAGR